MYRNFANLLFKLSVSTFLKKRFGEHYRRMNKPKKMIIFCIGTLNGKVTPLLIFWFSQWKKLFMMQIQQVDLKLSKDTKPN